MFLYTAVGFLAVMGLMLGFVQWQSGMEAWGFWGAYLGFPGLGALYAVSATGQRLSAHQMEALRERIGDLVEGLEIPSRAADVASDSGPGRDQSPRI